jgi:glycerate 2-kinase
VTTLRNPAVELVGAIFADVTAACDGGALVAESLGAGAPFASMGTNRPLHVLALGKAAGPMLAGALRIWPVGGPVHLGRGLVIAPEARADALPGLPPGFESIGAQHPNPGDGSVRAGQAARDLIAGLPPGDPLLVLLSGGGSALACLPAAGLTLADKRAAIGAVAAAGAPIAQLNTVRKHLSAIKGGQLGRLARGPVLVLALSDVVGSDPGTIASGPFSPDPTTFADALSILTTHAHPAPPSLNAAISHLRSGVAGQQRETPKPGPGWDHVDYRVIAGPDHVVAAATRSARALSLHPTVLVRDTQADVAALANTYLEQARRVAATGPGAGATVLGIGNGEPTIDLRSAATTGRAMGAGGRATHLALLVARGLASFAGSAADPWLAFLAAGTDDRDGNSDAQGAVVDATTWSRALERGLDPQGALDRFDSAGLLGALGCLVRGPGTSNLLDLHLLAATGR